MFRFRDIFNMKVVRFGRVGFAGCPRLLYIIRENIHW
jgi:hypothetical protein